MRASASTDATGFSLKKNGSGPRKGKICKTRRGKSAFQGVHPHQHMDKRKCDAHFYIRPPARHRWLAGLTFFVKAAF